MDELNRDFDPLNEYAQLEQNNESENTPQQTVEADAAYNNDAFGTFDKAENTQAISQNVQTEAENTTLDEQYTQPQYTQQQHTQPQYIQPQHTPQQYAQPPYVQPRAFTQPPQQPPQVPNVNPPFPTAPYHPQPTQPPYTVQPPQAPQPPQPYGAPFSQYKQQPPVTNTNPQSTYTKNPYLQNGAYNPYTANQPQSQAPAQKPKVPTGTKVLIGVLIGLLALFVIFFAVSCTKMIIDNKDAGSKNPLSNYATEPNFDDFFSDDFSDDFSSPYFNFEPSYDGDTFKEDITLQADEGQTQDKNEDDKNNTYAPDEKAKDVEFEKLPKDKDDKKYTTQSAYNTVTDSVVSVVCYEDKITDNDEDIVGEGTGTVISSDGYILTNSHVIGDSKAYTINIILNNSDEYQAKIVGYDTRTDLAVLKINAKNLSYVKFSDSSLVEVGQDIVAIGNPGGTSFQNSLTKGIVSAVDRELELSANVEYIQIDAAINPGNSGGPLCNLYGQVIGINTAKISSEEYEGMGFAIPSNKAAEIANDLIHFGYVKDRVRIGIMGREVDEEMKATYGVPYGVLITEIDEDGPLADTDIKAYDIITEIDGKEVSSFQEIFSILEGHKPGDKVKLTLYRLEE